MMDVIDLGIGEVMKRITEKFNNKPIHLSFDIDAVDPRYAPATGTKVPHFKFF
jgi:arginase family enzyme